MERRNCGLVQDLYNRTLGRILPRERLLSLLCCVSLNSVVYWGAQTFTHSWHHFDMTTALDRMVPVIPAWTVVYVAAFAFWALSYVLMARGPEWYTIMTAQVLCKLLCGVVFFLLPTTNVRPELGQEPFAWLLNLVYRLDEAVCLFPSIHCLESWICFAGLRNRRDLPAALRWGNLVFALLICLSTLFTYQHVVADVIAGVLLGEGMIQLSRRRGWGGRLERVFTRFAA